MSCLQEVLKNCRPAWNQWIVTKFFLIRHAEIDLAAHTLAGRMPGVHLNSAGRKQAERLAHKLASSGITEILSSPLERALETATYLGKLLGLQTRIAPAFHELDFGDWTGKKFVELDQIERWKQWNAFRLLTRPPNGEMMIEAQTRFVIELQRLRVERPNEVFAIFSHGDPLKSVLMFFLGMSLEHYHLLDISMGSFSVLSVDNWKAQLTGFNLKAD
jgi:probable phosphoglycerate mutase